MKNIDKSHILNHTTIVSVASRYGEVKRLGKEWITLCPWHTDTHPSLTIFEGKAGYERCHCHACGNGGNVIDYYMQQTASTYPETLESLSDGKLLGASDKPMVASSKPIKPAEWMAAKPPANNVPSFTHYELGEAKGVWCYRDGNGEPLYYECRYETIDEDGEITKHPRCLTWGRLSAHTPYKWSARHWPSPRPLYGLDQIKRFSDTSSIVVFEGPRKAELAQSLLKSPCVAWAAGANSWMQADWSVCEGRKVILFPDNDDKGIKAMDALAQHLIVRHKAKVSIVNLPEKADKWDICDEINLSAEQLKKWIADRKDIKKMAQPARKYILDVSKVVDGDSGIDSDSLPANVVPITANAPAHIPAPSATGEWTDTPEDLVNTELVAKPFNPDWFPSQIAELAQLKAKHIGTDPCGLVMSMMAVTASAIHDGIQIYPDRYGQWAESARIWVALVGTASASKSPAIAYASRRIEKIDDDAHLRNAPLKKKHEAAMKKWSKSYNEWTETDMSQPEPPMPPAPELQRFVIKAATIEGFRDVMRYNQRGMLMLVDELSGWMGGMNQYKGGAGSDRAEWLQAYNGGSMKIERSSTGTIYVPNWSSCVLGGIQPDKIAEIARKTADDGLLQRFLISHIPETDSGVSPTLQESHKVKELELIYNGMLDHLSTTAPSGERIEMSDSARQVTRELFLELHAHCKLGIYGQTAISAIKKLEGGIHRLCLIYHCIDCATKSIYPSQVPVSEEIARKVSKLVTEYTVPSLTVFYSQVLGERSMMQDIKRLAEWLLEHPCTRITASDLQQGCSYLRTKSLYERKEMLGYLSGAGWIEAESIERTALSGLPKRWKVNPAIYTVYKNEAAKLQDLMVQRRIAMEKAGMIKAVPGKRPENSSDADLKAIA